MNLEEQRQFILSGKVYNDLTPELVKARENTVFLTNKYNVLSIRTRIKNKK